VLARTPAPGLGLFALGARPGELVMAKPCPGQLSGRSMNRRSAPDRRRGIRRPKIELIE
jgi:hypothetical protein